MPQEYEILEDFDNMPIEDIPSDGEINIMMDDA